MKILFPSCLITGLPLFHVKNCEQGRFCLIIERPSVKVPWSGDMGRPMVIPGHNIGSSGEEHLFWLDLCLKCMVAR